MLGWLRSRLFLILAILTLVAMATSGNAEAGGNTYTVNSSGDSLDWFPGDLECSTSPGNSTCTLRAAIMEANAFSGTDTIEFSYLSGPRTITPGSALPVIIYPVIINATTQPGYSGLPLIELNGNNLDADGLVVTVGDVTIKGLVINRFRRDQIELRSGGPTTVLGNFIGIDTAGTAALPPASGYNGGVGIRVGMPASGATAIIGGDTPAERNVIGGLPAGIWIEAGSESSGITGNYIGTNLTGTAALPNTYGVVVNANENQIGSTGGVTPGGACTGECNLISGNSTAGIWLQAPYVGTSVAVDVMSNYIGTNASGNAAIPNSIGIWQGGGAHIGSNINVAASRNVISGNSSHGIFTNVANSQHNMIRGNFIGTDSSGLADLGNGGAGIFFDIGHDNVVGASSDLFPGSENVIAYNLIGVRIGGVSTSFSHLVSGNSIHSNDGLGIDLGGDGVTANDNLDADSGPNTLQNFPVLLSATAGSTHVQGTFNSTANVPFRIEFFANDSCDASGYGEGQTYLGYDEVTTNGSGDADIDVILAASVAVGKFITSTAYRFDSSEFSNCVVVTAAATSTPSPAPTATASPSATATGPTPSGQTQTPTITPTPTSSGPTPSGQTPTPTATSTPTPATTTPTPFLPEQANVNCDDSTDIADVIVMLKASGGLDYDQEPGCPDPGDSFGGIVFGDANCDGLFNMWDALDLLLVLGGYQPLAGTCDG